MVRYDQLKASVMPFLLGQWLHTKVLSLPWYAVVRVGKGGEKVF
jgi:hypothetical protein